MTDDSDNNIRDIVELYTPQIYNFVRRFVGYSDADDITQEVFIKVWRNLNKYNKDKSSFKTWLFTIARNTTIDFMRKKKTVLFSSLNTEENDFADNIKDETILPDEVLEKIQDKELLNSFIEKLPEQYKTVLILYYQEEMTFNEISQVLKKPLNTVKSHHFRALGKLKYMIAPKDK